MHANARSDATQETLSAPFQEWLLLDQYEMTEGEKKGKPREKVSSVEEMLRVIHQLKQGNP